jgi:hypothetical protein
VRGSGLSVSLDKHYLEGIPAMPVTESLSTVFMTFSEMGMYQKPVDICCSEPFLPV